MSQYYETRVSVPILSTQKNLGRKQQSLDDVIGQLKKTRPDLALRLAAVDWERVIEQVARESLAHVAAANGCEVDGSRGQRGPKSGRCLGVLRDKTGRVRLGLAMLGQELSFFWRGASAKPNAKQAKWQEHFERAYREKALAAALRIIGTGEVERKENADGSVKLTAGIKEAG